MYWAIGDIQGCYDPFMRLLEKIDFNPDRDRLALCGDIVNRGKKSKEVMEYIYSIRDSVDLVLGNHDISLIAIYLGLKKPNHTLKALLESPMLDKWIEYLISRPFVFETRDFVMVHAGIPPRFDLDTALKFNDILSERLKSKDNREWLSQMMSGEQEDIEDFEDSIKTQRYAIGGFTRMRFCKADGSLDFEHKGSPFKEKNGSLFPWFVSPNRKKIPKRIIFGHWSTLGYFENSEVSALDSGCLWRGQLTAKRLDSDGEIVQVECYEGIEPY